MHFSASLDAVAYLGHPDSLEQFRADLDPAWIEEALQSTGTATLRKRRLPAEQVIWLVGQLSRKWPFGSPSRAAISRRWT